MRRIVPALVAIAFLANAPLDAQKRKKKGEDDYPLLLPLDEDDPRNKKRKKNEEITQTLDVLPDPPAALAAEPQRFTFHVSPLSNKGLLSQQIRDGLKSVVGSAKGNPIVKLRAFVSGTGDQRRVQALVSETFSERRATLPVLTTVLVGALPMEGAQVLIEAVAADRKTVNPHGLAFFSGQGATDAEPLKPMAPLARKSVDNLMLAAKGAGVAAGDMLRVTCLLTGLDQLSEVRSMVAAAFPQAVASFVQLQRSSSSSVAECEGVGRLANAPASPLQFLNPEGLTASPNYSQVALVNAPKVILSGGQLAFRAQDADVRLAFDRLKKTVEGAGGSLKRVAMSSVYPLSSAVTDRVRNLRFEYYDKQNPPASTLVLFEGLPSLDASFAVDVVAVP
ncbi:MAG: RidA family protein [Acidobacteria bacterium]|nr:RidA family protein [Acidobacteriota bacterium]